MPDYIDDDRDVIGNIDLLNAVGEQRDSQFKKSIDDALDPSKLPTETGAIVTATESGAGVAVAVGNDKVQAGGFLRRTWDGARSWGAYLRFGGRK